MVIILKLIRLKYPSFAGKLNVSQAEHMLKDHAYVSRSYDDELKGYLDWTGLEDRDVVIQYPFTEEVVVQKSEEELARIAERKKESGRRLQEQAAKMDFADSLSQTFSPVLQSPDEGIEGASTSPCPELI